MMDDTSDSNKQNPESEESGNSLQTKKSNLNIITKASIGLGLIAIVSFGSYLGYGQYKNIRSSSLEKSGDQEYSAKNYENSIQDYNESLGYKSSSVVSEKLQNAKQMQKWIDTSKVDDLEKLKSLDGELSLADVKKYPNAQDVINDVEAHISQIAVAKAKVALGNGDLNQAEAMISETSRFKSKDSSTVQEIKKQIGDKLYAQASSSFDAGNISDADAECAQASTYLPSGDSNLVALQSKIKAKEDEQARIKKQQEEEARKPPLEIVYTSMGRNSIGDPEVTVVVKNVGKKVIDAFKVSIVPYDAFDKDVEFGGGAFSGIAENLILQPNEQYGSDRYWTLYNDETATHFVATIKEVHYTDGTTWDINNSNSDSGGI